jgi:hypothetical protein
MSREDDRFRVAYGIQPGTPEREKVLAAALEKCKDQELARKSAALRSRGEPSVPTQLALDGRDLFLRRK